MIMQTAPSKPKNAAARPAITAVNLADWAAQTQTVFQDLETHIYGPVPTSLSLRLESRQDIAGTHFGGSARLETRQFSVLQNAQDTGISFGMVLVRPMKNQKRHTPATQTPVIMMQNFCPNHDVIPHPDIPKPKEIYFSCSGGGVMGNVFTYFFGRYITTPPIEDIMARGYALAAVYPSEFIPDNNDRARPVLDRLFAGQDPETRTGTIAGWAAQFSLISGHLDQDENYGPQAAYGHSRFGKSALLAAAFNPAIDAVIAHQSGTGGASLTKDKPGETLTDITREYPHWFNRKFASYAGREDALPVDQHHLLALIAPRPVMLGNAKRDVWSDPNGAFLAARAAAPIYRLYGKDGLTARRLTEFKPEDGSAFWMRPGTHGVVKEDWPAFLDFLDAHLKQSPD